MNHYLYVLLFKNNTHFKIGISRNNNNRLKQHERTYGIDVEKSYIFQSSCSTHIKTLERMLLCLYPEVTSELYSDTDGHTEIRDAIYYEDCLRQMDYYQNLFLLKKTPLTFLVSEPKTRFVKQVLCDDIIKADILGFDMLLSGLLYSKIEDDEFIYYEIASHLQMSYFNNHKLSIVYFSKKQNITKMILRRETIISK